MRYNVVYKARIIKQNNGSLYRYQWKVWLDQNVKDSSYTDYALTKFGARFGVNRRAKKLVRQLENSEPPVIVDEYEREI